jgi:isoamylase
VFQSGLRDIWWFRADGREMSRRDWQRSDVRTLGVFLNGEELPSSLARGDRLFDDSFVLMVNAAEEEAAFRMPARRFGNRWVLVVSTADPAASEGSAAYPARGICPVPARSLTLLRRSW